MSATTTTGASATMNGKQMIPLSEVPTASQVRLIRVDAGRGLQQRLAALGLIPGVQIQVIRNSRRGQLIVGVKNSRIVLGRGMSQKMLVSQ